MDVGKVKSGGKREGLRWKKGQGLCVGKRGKC